MKLNKTLIILNNLTKGEKKDFFEFCNTDKEATPQHRKLLDLILKDSLKSLDAYAENIHTKVERIPKLLHEILRLFERWVCTDVVQNTLTSIRSDELLVIYYAENNFLQYANQKLVKLKSTNTKYLSAIELRDLFYANRTMDRITKLNGKNLSIDPTDYIYLFDLYHGIERLKIYCESVNRKNIFFSNNNQIDLYFYYSLKKHSLILDLYIDVYNCLVNINTIKLKDITAIVGKVKSLENRNEIQVDVHTLNHYIINLYLSLIKNGQNETYRMNFFDFLNYLKQKGLLVERNQIDSSLFKVCLKNSLMLGMNDWAENFLNQYTKFLPIENRENNVLYFKILLHYKQGDFNKIAEIVSKSLDYDKLGVFQRLEVFRIRLKINYEESKDKPNYQYGDDTFVKSILKNYKSFVLKSVMSNMHKQLHHNFIRNYQMLCLNSTDSIRYYPTSEKEWIEDMYMKKER